MPTLVLLPDGHQLDASAARSYDRMCAARGRVLVITSAWRSRAEQQRLYDGWTARLAGFNFALPPGSSQHELGLAIDFDPAEYAWLVLWAALFGWYRTNPAERWHYEYDWTRDKHLTAPVASIPAPAHLTPTATVQEDDMAHILLARGGAWIKDGPRIDWLDGPTLAAYRAIRFADGTPRFPEVTVSDVVFSSWREDTSTAPTLVRSPGSGVGILAGAGGFTALADQSDVNAFRAAGSREVAITDADFARLANPTA